MVLSDERTPPPRERWMDLLRGAAVLLVVVWHVFAVAPLFGGSESPEIVIALNNALSPFRIPTLLVLSGLLLERSLAKGRLRYVTGKLRHIARPYLLWSVLIAAVSIPGPDLTSPWFWLGGNILWYLPVILFCYAAALCRPQWVPWWICVLAPLILLWTVEPSTNAYIRFLWYGAYFFLGAQLSRVVPALQSRTNTLAAAVLWSAAVVGGALVVAGGIRGGTPLFFLVSVAGILAVLHTAPRVPESRGVRLLEWYGRNSIVVYVAHAFAMLGTMSLLGQMDAVHSPVVIPLLALVGFGVPTVLILLRPRVRWLFEFPAGRAPASSLRDGAVLRGGGA